MWYKFLIPTTANLKIAGMALGGIAIAGTLWWAYSQGQDRGFGNAYDQFQKDIDGLKKSWTESVIARDQEINAIVSSQFNDLEEKLRIYISNEESERELLERLAVIDSTLSEIRNETSTTNFGECNLSDDFERLLNSAQDAIRPSTTDSPTPSP
jgi:hypothetical protein